MTRGMAVYIVQRVLLIAITALIVSSVVFIAVHQLPGTAFLTDRPSSPRRLEILLHQYGLDRPWWQQYLSWLSGAVRGDLGESFVLRGQKLTPLLLNELGVSATLGICAMAITIVGGMGLGILAAIKQNTWVDYAASGLATIGYSIPSFVAASILVLISVSGLYRLTGGLFYENVGWGRPEQVPVPALALGLLPMCLVARLTRASMLETIRQDYVRTAWAKGLRARVVVLRHALRNALIPVVTVLGPIATSVITGSVVIEQIFGIPGLGKEFIQSILSRDYNTVIGVFTFYAVLVGFVNLVVDLVYPLLDPRIRY
ncbi:MAG: ABC transporter permease [Candidatus Dormibacteraeota bacterium]|nr:ABC transporter permease [Candidatus Dormibacteraeota bacterium]